MAERILLIDDDESLSYICGLALKRAGYDVTTADSGDEAVKILESAEFDLVITDLSMPGTHDGAAVVRRVKTRHPGTEVLVLTAVPTLETAVETLKHGASDYIIKPLSTEHLKLTVQRCLNHRRLKEELSAERALCQELNSAYKELQKVERLKESFIARVSHELRTPLNQLLVALKLFEDEFHQTQKGNVQKAIALLNTSVEGAERLEKTILHLLTFVDSRNIQTVPKPSIVDIKKISLETIEKLKPLWEPLHLTVHAEFPEEDLRCPGDEAALRMALEYLVHNAIVFNSDRGKISLAGKLLPDEIVLSISDSGEGIPESEFPKIFDGFYQIAYYLSRKVQGLGLGLAIARNVVEAHGGTIAISSKVGKGSTFTLKLPLKAKRPEDS